VNSDRPDRSTIKFRIQIVAVACGTLFTLLTIIGWLGMAQGLFPVPASLSPEQTAAYFAEHSLGMRTGCFLYIVGSGLFCIWIAQLGVMLAPIEGRGPVLSIAGVTAGNGVIAFVMMSCCLWISAAYRADADADVVVALNDAAWHGFLLTWPALSVQMISTGIVTKMDERETPLVPRWVTHFSVFCGLAIAMASGPAWAKAGPFAWNGVLAYYIPMILWALWFEIHSWYMLMALLRERREQTSAPAGAVPA
tara:strand:+ start:913 stop:1665 length:753 start_codon:yes stop_codon:yes gene_type:complete